MRLVTVDLLRTEVVAGKRVPVTHKLKKVPHQLTKSPSPLINEADFYLRDDTKGKTRGLRRLFLYETGILIAEFDIQSAKKAKSGTPSVSLVFETWIESSRIVSIKSSTAQGRECTLDDIDSQIRDATEQDSEWLKDTNSEHDSLRIVYVKSAAHRTRHIDKLSGLPKSRKKKWKMREISLRPLMGEILLVDQAFELPMTRDGVVQIFIWHKLLMQIAKPKPQSLGMFKPTLSQNTNSSQSLSASQKTVSTQSFSTIQNLDSDPLSDCTSVSSEATNSTCFRQLERANTIEMDSISITSVDSSFGTDDKEDQQMTTYRPIKRRSSRDEELDIFGMKRTLLEEISTIVMLPVGEQKSYARDVIVQSMERFLGDVKIFVIAHIPLLLEMSNGLMFMSLVGDRMSLIRLELKKLRKVFGRAGTQPEQLRILLAARLKNLVHQSNELFSTVHILTRQLLCGDEAGCERYALDKRALELVEHQPVLSPRAWQVQRRPRAIYRQQRRPSLPNLAIGQPFHEELKLRNHDVSNNDDVKISWDNDIHPVQSAILSTLTGFEKGLDPSMDLPEAAAVELDDPTSVEVISSSLNGGVSSVPGRAGATDHSQRMSGAWWSDGNSTALPHSSTNLAEKRRSGLQHFALQLQIPERFLTNQPKPTHLRSITSVDFTMSIFDLRPVDVARQLWHLDASMFLGVEPNDLYSFAKSAMSSREKDMPTEGNNEPDPLHRSIQQFNQLVLFVATTVLIQETPRTRAEVIVRFIRIAKKCRKWNNFHSLKALISGLQCNAVYRLDATWQRVPQKSKKAFNTLVKTVSEQNNHRDYRTKLALALWNSMDLCGQRSSLRPQVVKGILCSALSDPMHAEDTVKNVCCTATEGNNTDIPPIPYLGVVVSDITYLQAIGKGLKDLPDDSKTKRVKLERQEAHYRSLATTHDLMRGGMLMVMEQVDHLYGKSAQTTQCHGVDVHGPTVSGSSTKHSRKACPTTVDHSLEQSRVEKLKDALTGLLRGGVAGWGSGNDMAKASSTSNTTVSGGNSAVERSVPQEASVAQSTESSVRPENVKASTQIGMKLGPRMVTLQQYLLHSPTLSEDENYALSMQRESTNGTAKGVPAGSVNDSKDGLEDLSVRVNGKTYRLSTVLEPQILMERPLDRLRNSLVRWEKALETIREDVVGSTGADSPITGTTGSTATDSEHGQHDTPPDVTVASPHKVNISSGAARERLAHAAAATRLQNQWRQKPSSGLQSAMFSTDPIDNSSTGAGPERSARIQRMWEMQRIVTLHRRAIKMREKELNERYGEKQ
eukprot:Clim_evm2s220 gene=Clim_evmTU2s220